MNSTRKTAITVGTLFLIALVVNLIASGITDSTLSVSNYLAKAFPHRNTVIVGTLLNFIAAISMIFIPICLFPVVRRQQRNLAVSYIVFRALEGILFIYMAINTLTLINVSKSYLGAQVQNVLNVQTLGDSIQSQIRWAMLIYITIYSLGALTFYSLLYKSKLLPNFISVGGLIAAVLMIVGALLGIFSLGIFAHAPLMTAMRYFAPPIALNELILSIWLIVKGFDSSGVESHRLSKTIHGSELEPLS